MWEGGTRWAHAGAGRDEPVPRVPGTPGGRRLPRGQPARGEGGDAAAGPAEPLPVSAVATAGPAHGEISKAQDGICPSFCLVFPLPPCACLAMIIAFIRLCLPYILPGAVPAGSGEGNGRFSSAVSGLAAGLSAGCPAALRALLGPAAGEGWQGILCSGNVTSRTQPRQ